MGIVRFDRMFFVKLKSAYEGSLQLGKEMKWSSKEGNMSSYGFTTGKA